MVLGFASGLIPGYRFSSKYRTRTLIQMENAECGAAALGIILEYYGRIVPLSELRQECGVSRDGSKASNIIRAAGQYGLEAKGFKMPIEQLKQARLPCIVFWDFNHFVVVELFEQDKVYLNDPASGRRRVSYDAFNRSYTGVALILEPGETFERGGSKPSVLSALVNRLKYSKQAIAFGLIAGLLLTLPRLAMPAFAQVFVDEVLVQSRQDWLRPLLMGMLLIALIQGLLARLQLTVLRRFLVKLSVTMSGQFLWYILRLPVGYYDQRYAGEISNRISLNDKVASVVTGSVATTVISALMIVVYGTIMFVYDRVLTVIAIASVVLNLMALAVVASNRRDATMKLAQASGKTTGMVIGSLQSIESVKASGLESDLFSKFAGHYAKQINALQEIALPTLFLGTIPALMNALTSMVILVVGSFRVMNGELTIGMLLAYQSLSQSFTGPIFTLLGFAGTLQDLEADLNRLDDVLQNPLDPEVERDRSAEIDSDQLLTFGMTRLKGHVELRNLTFGYNRLVPPIIEGFNLTVRPGQRVALVGTSGSGKSTISKLVTGLYAPWQGEILLSGKLRNQIPRSVLARSFALVEQDIFLFAGTIKDNLTLWDSTIPMEDLVRACKDAAIHDLILSLPGGYDAMLTEGGMNISGGQRQRLEIARALVRNPTILVLDEATSALDAETEMIVDRNLRQRGCTCIVVAHRLSTIRDCDEIVVLEHGKVVQRGTHDELRHQMGSYWKLVGSPTLERTIA